MSTKLSLYYTDSMHLYRECLDEDSVYLKINKDMLNIKIDFNIEDFARIACSFDMDSLERQCALTDEQIMDYCKLRVEERIGCNGVKAICGFGVYGSASQPKELQETNGFNFFVARRNKLREILASLRARKSSVMKLGLEDIVTVNYEE